MHAVTNTVPVEHAACAEPDLLDLATAGELLRERGYELVERFGHVHAAAGGWEWHVCLLADLASLSPSRLLGLLEESIKHSIQPAYSP